MNNEVLNLIKSDINEFNNGLINNAKTAIKDFEPILNYIFSTKGKQIRPILGILLAKCISNSFSIKQNLFLQAIELTHNATLFHDDVIDEADIRRNKKTLHKEFSNKIAILAGDYFLSIAIKNIYTLNNPQINSLFAEYMKAICEGEIEQNLSLNKIISLEEYISKTEKKTALLFELTTSGIATLSDNPNKEIIKYCQNLGKNLGILFQLNDDLNNFYPQKDKPILNDLKSGVITAPIIFLNEEYPETQTLINEQKYDTILENLNNSNAWDKTKILIQKYYNETEKYLNLLPQNIYTDAIYTLLSKFRNN